MEEPLRERALGRDAATGGDGRALLLGDGHVRRDLLLRGLRDDRTEIGPRIEAVAHLHLLRPRDELVDDRVRDPLVRDDT